MTSIGTMLSLKDEYCTEIEAKKNNFDKILLKHFQKSTQL